MVVLFKCDKRNYCSNMDGLRAKLPDGDRDALSLVLHFLDTAALAEKPESAGDRSLVARLCAESITVFQVIVKHLLSAKEEGEEAAKTHTSLQRSFSRLKLWSDGYGIAGGELDAIFAKSQYARRATLPILASIGRTLVESMNATRCDPRPQTRAYHGYQSTTKSDTRLKPTRSTDSHHWTMMGG